MKRALFVAVVGAVLMGQFVGAQQAPVVSPNVDVIGGPVVKIHPWQGDPFGQRQDEGSCFVDSRNPLVIGCAYNDYTTVEIPGSSTDGETGDAWLGRSVSTDGGATFRKFLLPGYPQDTSAIGTSSPLHGFQAAADPTWRSGPGGRSYLTGIAFNRDSGGAQAAGGVVFVQPYINNNNIQNDPDPLKPDPAINGGQPVIIESGNEGRFQDKPWAAVGADGKLYVTYATFLGSGANPHSDVWVQVSDDGGRTFRRKKLSESDRVNNGTIIVPHPDRACLVDVAYRRRESGTQTDSIEFVRTQTLSGWPTRWSPWDLPKPGY